MPHAQTLLIAGTASHVGKSTVATGLCRVLADRGVSVAPFKAQNMSNNARAVPIARAGTDEDGGTTGDGVTVDEGAVTTDAFGEIGVSQYVQARAARVPATSDHNPVLLKPRGGGESQLVIHGAAVGHFAAGDYYDEHWERARAAAEESWRRLAAAHDVVVAEGAGSIAEINLHDRDLANVETARFADAAVVLVADIERGGVFASLVGTLELIPNDLRERVEGCVVTKFRGDRALLGPGVESFEGRTGVPVLGVVPYDDPGLPEEDSVALPAVGERAVHGGDDGVSDHESVTIAVPRFPRASNVTDLEPLAREPGVRVGYVPLDASLDHTGPDVGADAGADAVVLSGTKNTVDDLLAARDAGLLDRLRRFDGPVVGLCGGYQLLGERVTNAAAEGTGDGDEVAGAGLLPVETRFSPEKRVAAVEWELRGCGPLAGASGPVSGYEIHAGETSVTGDVARPFPEVPDGAATDRVLGTYLHGLFEHAVARDAFLDGVFADAGLERPSHDGDDGGRSPYDRAADLVREHVDLTPLGL